ncbi:winged helix-turn-helix domain-containing protein [Roseovarius sp. S1116L3]|uniref:winged helix-turn-helix domain-containing protein n=1 Tax=Roseovarius roseus TaxID=3342636 RepID=UPI00372AB2AB
MNTPSTIRFSGFVLNRARGCLEDAEGAERALRPKSYRLLEVLLERRGQLLSKDELVREVWPDVFVSDDSLAHCISDIRRTLGPEGAGVLRTVPRRGYMLLAEDAVPGITRPQHGMVKHLWAGGIAAALLMASAGHWWAVISNAGGSTYLAASTELSPELRAQSLLDARTWRSRENNDKARALLEAIVAKTPDNADAWASLGLTYWLEVWHLAWGGGRREMVQALEMVERAIEIGGSARSHRLLAEMRLLAPFPDMRSPIDAMANAQAAVAIDSTDADNLAVLARVFAMTGRAADAVRMIEQARRLDPEAPDWYREVAGLSYLLNGEPARAAEEFGPLNGAGTFVNARWWPGWLLASSLAHAGRINEATAVVRAAQGRRPAQSIASVAQSLEGFADPSNLGVVLDGLRMAGVPD